MGYRAWQHVKRDLVRARAKLTLAMDHAARHMDLSEAAAERIRRAEEAYWEVDREARKYRKFMGAGVPLAKG